MRRLALGYPDSPDVEGISKKLNMEITNQSANYFIQTKGWSNPLIIGLVTAVNAMMNDEKATKDRRITRFFKKFV
uniref:Uncharacterized protein n=1 Tax=Strigamia maritima TaxID=126957 RepID=T1J1W3_STRMM